MSAPVDDARDEYAAAMNLELRRSIAARVLEAMDVDQYLIDAVRNAKPPVAQAESSIGEPLETFSVVKARDKQRPGSGLFWTRVNGGWMDDKEGRFRAWHLLDVVEVLRVGIGEPTMAPAQQNAQVWQSLTGRVIRFCMRSQNCRMADGHDGGCQS